jgi:hypothetical protein
MANTVIYESNNTSVVITHNGMKMGRITRHGNFYQIDIRYTEGGAENYMCNGVEKWNYWSSASEPELGLIYRRLEIIKNRLIKLAPDLKLEDYDQIPNVYARYDTVIV